MSQSLAKLYSHIVFHVNFADGITIPGKLQPVLHAYVATICKNQDSPSIVVGGTNDHIHILCNLSKNIAAATLLKEIKISSSKWIKSQAQEYELILDKFSWQKGYGIFSVSASQIDVLKNYIINQQAHHKKISFKDEYILFLKKYNIEYNEEYLWS
jgi:REP-associated tyrosine transposase